MMRMLQWKYKPDYDVVNLLGVIILKYLFAPAAAAYSLIARYLTHYQLPTLHRLFSTHSKRFGQMLHLRLTQTCLELDTGFAEQQLLDAPVVSSSFHIDQTQLG